MNTYHRHTVPKFVINVILNMVGCAEIKNAEMMKNVRTLEEERAVESAYKDFILTKKHPCVMANTIFAMGKYHLKIYDSMTEDAIIHPILSDIENYLEHYDFDSPDFETLIFCFKNDTFKTEITFEKALWTLLQKLHNNDDTEWDPTVKDDPESPEFSFSLKGRAFYVIGLHPNSSRLARQAPFVTIAFNLHWQFEKLREMNIYQSVKKRIRKRDRQLQGSINPVLRDFGMDTETKQYSGRNVEKEWKCPFHAKSK